MVTSQNNRVRYSKRPVLSIPSRFSNLRRATNRILTDINEFSLSNVHHTIEDGFNLNETDGN